MIDLARIGIRKGKGRAIIATDWIPEGRLLETCPILLVPHKDCPKKSAVVHRYSFEWGKMASALVLGWSQLLNHSYKPNVAYRYDRSRKVIEFRSIRHIKRGDELTINYLFHPDARGPVGFEVLP
jgi:hypothetical protein